MFAEDAESLIRLGNWPALKALADQWSRQHPDDDRAWRTLSRAEYELGRYRMALDAFRKTVDLSGRNAADLTTLGRIAIHALEFDVASAALTEARAVEPDAPELLFALGMLSTYLGRFEDAEICCRRCLEHSPEFAPAFTILGRVNGSRFTDPEMTVLSRLAQSPGTPIDHRIAAAFSLAHGNEARGDFNKAFAGYEYAHFLAGERDQREGRSYDRAGTEVRINRLISFFARREPEPQPGRDTKPVPIFIVGMPRSGTTLVECVLAAHSRVVAGGERPEMQQILDAFLRMDPGSGVPPPESSLLEAWRRAYRAGVACESPADHFTDKHPLNLEAAGLIARMFPESVIVHVRRNPLETGVSIYRNEFPKFWTFTHRLADIGHFHGQYARLAAHWERILGPRFQTVQYEDFAGSFESSAPALVAACGLRWEAQCGAFQHQRRAIATLSAVQAREPVRMRSGAAQRYSAFTGPLIEALRAAHVDPVTGACRAGASGR